MENTTISIIIPVYNVEQFLPKCVESVLNQSYTNLEIILVDDGALDSSGKMCDSFAAKDKRVKVIHKDNGGLSDARNAGLKKATGKYVAFIDSDDYIHIDYIKKLYEGIVEDNCDLSICSCDKVIQDVPCDKKIGEVKKINYDAEEAKLKILSRQIPFYAPGKLFSSKLIPYLHFPEGKLYEDVPTIWNVLKHVEKVCYLPEKLYFYRQRRGSIVNNTYKHGRMDQLYFAEQIMEEMDEKDPLYYTSVSRCFFSAMDNYALVNNQFMDDKKYLRDAVVKYSKGVMLDKYADKNLAMMARLVAISPEIARIAGKLYKIISINKIK